MKPPKAKTLAGGRNWSELDEQAKASIKAGDEYWPSIVRTLLKRNYELEKRIAEISQGEMFPTQMHAKRAIGV